MKVETVADETLITCSKDEAEILQVVLGRIAGDSLGPRGFTEKLYRDLNKKCGIEYQNKFYKYISGTLNFKVPSFYSNPVLSSNIDGDF